MFVSSPVDWGQPKRPLLPPRLHWGQSESKMQNCKNFLKKLMLSSDQAMKIMKIMRIWMGVAIVPTTHRPQPRPHQGEFLRIGCQVSEWRILNYIDLQIWRPLVVHFLNLWVCGLFRMTNFRNDKNLPPRLHWDQSKSKMQSCKNFLNNETTASPGWVSEKRLSIFRVSDAKLYRLANMVASGGQFSRPSESQIFEMTKSASKCLKSGTHLLFDKAEKLNINFDYILLFRPRPVRPSPTKQRAATPCPARPSPYKQRTATPCPSRPGTARPRSNMAAHLRANLD